MEHIQICCLEETHSETIIQPLILIYASNGFEGYSTNIYIPSKTDPTCETDILIRQKFFIGAKAMYQNMALYDI